MKISKFLALAVVAAFASLVFADANNKLIAFSTVGPDKYADGTTVLDGEWYALVWSADGVFEGFTPECAAVDPNDRVVILASLAKGGCCPYTVFQVDSKSVNFKNSGTYAVYLLDTRSADKQSVAAVTADGKPASVNGVLASSNYNASAASAGGAEGTVPGSVLWGKSSDIGLGQPRITAFSVNGAMVSITADGLVPEVKYNVLMGPELDSLSVYGLEIPKGGVTTADFVINNLDSKYFKIVREPLARPAVKEEK